VVTFGENEAFRQVPNPKGSWLRNMQELMSTTLGWTAPLFYGRGIVQYGCGMLPHRHPLHTVVGPPLKLPTIASPTQADVDTWHAEYVKLLSRIYAVYHDRYLPRPDLLVSEPVAGEMPPVGMGDKDEDKAGRADSDESAGEQPAVVPKNSPVRCSLNDDSDQDASEGQADAGDGTDSPKGGKASTPLRIVG